MDLMQCCPWSRGFVENFLYTAPCPPSIMSYSDFQKFVLDQNHSENEFCIIANKCNVFSPSTPVTDITSTACRLNMSTTTIHGTSDSPHTADTTEVSTTTIHGTSDSPHTADTTEVSSNATLHITTTTARLPISHVTPPVTTPPPGDVLIIGVTCGIAAAIILTILTFLLVMKHRKQAFGESQNRTTTHVLVCVSISCDNYSSTTSGTKISSERRNETETTLETFANSITVGDSVTSQNKNDKYTNIVTLEKKSDKERRSSAFDKKLETNTNCVNEENETEYEDEYVESEYENVSKHTDDQTKHENYFMKLDNKYPIEHDYNTILSDNNTNHKACGIDDDHNKIHTSYL